MSLGAGGVQEQPRLQQYEDPQKPGPYSGVRVLEILAEAKNYNRYLASLIEKRLGPNDTILDFGAGVGTFALPLVRQGRDVTGVEPDAQLAARLRDAGLAVTTGLSEVHDESIDLIYTFNVLEHIAEDGAALRALARKLRPSGRLLIYVPAFMVLYSSFDQEIGHLRRYRRRGLVNLVRAAGLQVVDARYADSVGFLAALLFRVLGRKEASVSRKAVDFYDRILFPLSRLADAALHRWIGKNLVVVAERDA
jgi:SAM-dependent methyltransferase